MLVEEKQKLTYEDFERLPEGAPYELIDGALIHDPPTTYHQHLSMGLSYAFLRFVRERNLGRVLAAPICVYLGEEHAFQPDLLFVSNERMGRIGEERIEGAPDLVAEILSPSTAYYDLRTKKRVYAETGVREYWIVDPFEQSIEVFENTGGRFELIARAEAGGSVPSKVLAGLTVALAEVF